MATLYLKPNSPNWFAQFYNAEGDRISRSTGTPKKREAEKIAASLEVKELELRKGNPGLPAEMAAIVETAAREAFAGELTLARAEELIQRLHRLANPTFKIVSLADHLSGWVKAQEPHVSDKTSRTYWDMHRRIVAAVGPKIAGAPVGDITKDDVEKAINTITKTTIKGAKTTTKGTKRKILAATANMDLRALRRALRVAVEEGLARANVADGVRPLPEDDSTERAPFTPAEVRAMIDSRHTPDEWKGVILLAAHTGLRLGDVIKLNRAHVEGTRLVIRPEKTKRGRKTLTVPLTPPCVGWIGEKKGDFFPNLKGTKIGTLSTTFTRIMKRAGVARDVTLAGDVSARRSFHCLRHSFTSWLADADVHADVRQKLTGHASAGVHAKYTHHDEALERAVATLPELWASNKHS
jgi:integrase